MIDINGIAGLDTHAAVERALRIGPLVPPQDVRAQGHALAALRPAGAELFGAPELVSAEQEDAGPPLGAATGVFRLLWFSYPLGDPAPASQPVGSMHTASRPLG